MALTEACQVCGPRAGVAPDTLFKCSRCHAALYCGRAHQSEDFATHKATCKRIKKMRDKMAEEADKIRSASEDDWTTANAFQTGIGRFWGLLNTRPYMRAKLGLLRALSSILSRPAIEAALDEAKDCLRLCRSDNLGVREVVPTLQLLLGQFQDAYDFIKWYASSGQASDYDWANMNLPYLDIHGADMTEQVPQSLWKDAINAHRVADNASLPALVTDSLGAFLIPNRRIRTLAELEEFHEVLEGQMHMAFSMVHFQNQNYWDAMLGPAPIINSPKPQHYEPGDRNQVRLWIQPNAMLWRVHHAFIRDYREDYPDVVPEAQRSGPKLIHNYH